MTTTEKIMGLAVEFAAEGAIGTVSNSMDRLEKAREALRAEIEAMARDAERYRWLRAKENCDHEAWNRFGPFSSPEEIDAAIDAAMKGEAP